MDLNIRKGLPEEAALISALAIRSKAHWGYNADQMRIFSEELTLAPEVIEERGTHVLEDGSQIVGYYTLLPQTESNVELEHLFIDPPHLRKGHGSHLLRHAIEQARSRGYARMLIQSDPFAEGFYRFHGAELIVRIPTNILNRTLPLMEIWLSPRRGS